MAQVSTVGLTDGTDTKIAAYQGASCGGTPLACHDDISDDVYESRVRFRVTAGARYLIQIGTFGDFAAPEDRFEIRIDQTVTLCAADIDGDGLVGLGDLFAYLTEYFSGSAGADFDEDGVISVGDILAFVTAFLEGCT
jgi:hypothetical protein